MQEGQSFPAGPGLAASQHGGLPEHLQALPRHPLSWEGPDHSPVLSPARPAQHLPTRAQRLTMVCWCRDAGVHMMLPCGGTEEPPKGL